MQYGSPVNKLNNESENENKLDNESDWIFTVKQVSYATEITQKTSTVAECYYEAVCQEQWPRKKSSMKWVCQVGPLRVNIMMPT